MIGGETNAPNVTASGVFTRVDIYKPSTNTWRSGPNLLQGLHGIYPTYDGKNIYLVGGGIKFGASSSSLFFTLALSQTSSGSSSTTPSPLPTTAKAPAITLSTAPLDISKSCTRPGVCNVYKSGASCQCDSSCSGYGDCCVDYKAVCLGQTTTSASTASTKTTTKAKTSAATTTKSTSTATSTATSTVFQPNNNNNNNNGQSTSTINPLASCAVQGCKYIDPAPCHCDDKCAGYKDCCGDYDSVCAAHSPPPPPPPPPAPSSQSSCAVQGCKYISSAPCKCDIECAGYNDCCADYSQICGV